MLEEQAVDISQVLQDSVQLFQPRAAAKRISLTCDSKLKAKR